ncbi:MAG: response regulator [Gammaproteobacteria bacterium]|nr:MAG: response regulator [Gammaproteobacteria bacterium]
MADNRNFAALDWLIHEIGETLKEARQALEAYVENPKDTVRIRFCLTHIHQVHGSLQMVEFFGAAMLAEEMEKLTQAMIQGAVANPAEAQEVLMRAILQFPVYLDQVKATRKDNPLVVLPLLNDLRTVRGESLLTDTKLFVPNLAPAKKVTGARSAAAHDNVQFQSMALKLRQMYQYAAAGYIRSVNSDENLAYLQKVFNRLHKLTQGTARHALWDICLALAEALEIDALEMSVAIKNLLRQLDKEIKILAVHGTKALNSYTNDELIKNLLYYVARAGKHVPGFTPNSHLQRVYETYRLNDALIEGKESGDESSNILSSPDPEAMRSVVEALKTELDIIKHALDVCLSGGDPQTVLNEALPVVKRISDTMAVLGLGDLRKQVLEQGAALELVANSDSHLSQEQLMSIASKVIEIEDALDSLAQQQFANVNNDAPSNEADITLTRAKESVLRESRNGLEHAKDAIIEYIASQWDRVHLQNVPDTLREIRGGLEIMPLPRAARILGACARYIEEQLLTQEITPQWSSLDTLADAITSVEYYLERLSGGSTKEENDLLLTVAEESVATLGYAVAKISRADSAIDVQAARMRLPEPEIHTTHEAAEADEASLAAAYESALQAEVEIDATDSNELTDATAQQLEDIYSSNEVATADAVSESAPQEVTELEPPSLFKNNAPSIGNHYPSPSTRISPAIMGGSIGVTLNSSPIDNASKKSAASDVISAVEDAGKDIEETIVSEAVVAEEQAALLDEYSHYDEDVAPPIVSDVETIAENPAEIKPAAHVDDDDDNYIDEEIIEIFVEEAGEVLQSIGEYFPRWANDFEDENSLTEFRRAFHTLKGSGRMVGANDLGELAWSIENMLNRVLDNSIEPGQPHVAIIEKARAILPDMVAAFSKKLPTPHLELSIHYRGLAESLAKGVVPDELSLSENSVVAQAKEFVTDIEDEAIQTADDEYINEDDIPSLDVVDEESFIAESVDHENDEPQELIAEAVEVKESESDSDISVETEQLESSDANSYASDESAEDSEAQLWDIFGAEALTHLQTLKDFIAHMEAEAPVYEPPSDNIQRALHTLKGSAHMAEITPIAELAAPLEKLVKELRSYHVVINEDILQLLRDAVSYTQTGLSQIERGEPVEIPRLHQFTARVHELREIHVAPLVRQQELDENGKRPVDPELLSIFMAEEMNLLLNADKIIEQWQAAPDNLAVLRPVLDELRNLNRGAHHAYLPLMANLGEKLEQVYTHIIAKRLVFSDSLCRDLNSAHLALLDMVDAIAAGQNLANAPESILDALDDLIAAANAKPEVDIEAQIFNELETADFEATAKLESHAEENSHESLPLIEGVDYEETEAPLLAEDDLVLDADIDLDLDVAQEEITLSADDSLDLGDELTLDIDDEDIPVLSVVETADDDLVEIESSDEDGEEITLELPDEDADFDAADEEFNNEILSLDASDILEDEIEDEALIEDAIEESLENETAEVVEASAGEPIADLEEELHETAVEELSSYDIAFELVDDTAENFEETTSLTEAEIVEEAIGFKVAPEYDNEIIEDEDFENIEDEIDFDFNGEENSADIEDELISEELADDDNSIELEDDTDTINSYEQDEELISAPSVAPQPQAIISQPVQQKIQQPVRQTEPQRPTFNAMDDEDYDPEIVEIFIEEALELLEDMERALHEWQEDWTNTDSVEELKRCLHTFKGGARLAGLSDLGDLSHDYETMLIEMDADAELDQNFFKQLNTYQDQLHSGVDQVRSGMGSESQVAEAPAQELEPVENDVEQTFEPESVAPINEYEPAPGFEYNRPSLVVDNDRPAAHQKPNVLTFAPKPKPPAAPLPKIPGAEFGGSRQGNAGPAQVQHLAARRAGPQEVVKVSAELLEELVNLAGETSISRGRMEQQVSDLGGSIEEMDATIHRLQEQLRRLDIETEAQVLFRQEQMMQHEQFDPLEMDRYSQLQQLSRSLIESASDLMDLKYTLADKTRDTETLLLQQSRINTDLQEGLMRSRMVPFSRLVPRLRRIVRQAATELGKEVDFELDNVEGELDRTVLERMVAPLEHMLRNAVDHGIELPADRTAAGKPAEGRIVLSLGREGGDVMLRLADDGRGINLQRVREKAIERGLMAADAPLSDQDLMQFILHAGFSTADKVTQISGRGVGMDVVHSEIKQLGGAMFIDSRWGEGTQFTIRLPFTVSVNRALMVQIGDDLYAIPLNTIEGIVRVSPFELEHYYQDPDARFDYAGDNYLVRYLGAMLDSDATPKLDGQSLPLPVILVRSTENTVALQVDRLLGSREIVVKTLGAQFSSVRGVSGATVTGDGSVVVILDLHALIREQLALGLNRAILLDPAQLHMGLEEDQAEKTIMVVDDSVTVRKVTGRFLEREGFRVITAKDGVEALQLLQDHVPDVMLLDIEMPRMDGFEVAKNIRTSSRLRDIPIIMITSRTGEKHREHAFELGVNKYMGKPYQEDLLLSNIKELIKSKS